MDGVGEVLPLHAGGGSRVPCRERVGTVGLGVVAGRRKDRLLDASRHNGTDVLGSIRGGLKQIDAKRQLYGVEFRKSGNARKY